MPSPSQHSDGSNLDGRSGRASIPRDRILRVLALCTLLGGCGEGFQTAEVSGSVKVDGKPAPGLMIQFEPDDGNGTKLPPSIGYTNADGQFVLVRPGRKTGTVVGKHTVRIMTGEGGDLVILNGRKITGTVSQREVTPGPNVIDVELTSIK